MNKELKEKYLWIIQKKPKITEVQAAFINEKIDSHIFFESVEKHIDKKIKFFEKVAPVFFAVMFFAFVIVCIYNEIFVAGAILPFILSIVTAYNNYNSWIELKELFRIYKETLAEFRTQLKHYGLVPVEQNIKKINSQRKK